MGLFKSGCDNPRNGWEISVVKKIGKEAIGFYSILVTKCYYLIANLHTKISKTCKQKYLDQGGYSKMH